MGRLMILRSSVSSGRMDGNSHRIGRNAQRSESSVDAVSKLARVTHSEVAWVRGVSLGRGRHETA